MTSRCHVHPPFMAFFVSAVLGYSRIYKRLLGKYTGASKYMVYTLPLYNRGGSRIFQMVGGGGGSILGLQAKKGGP